MLHSVFFRSLVNLSDVWPQIFMVGFSEGGWLATQSTPLDPSLTGWDFRVWQFGRIKGLAALTGFSYEKMYGHFTRTKNEAQ